MHCEFTLLERIQGRDSGITGLVSAQLCTLTGSQDNVLRSDLLAVILCG